MAIIGRRSLSRKLKDLPDEIRKDVIKMVAKSGRELEQTAKALVPVANTPGKIPLKETIRYRSTDNGLGFEVSAGGDRKREKIQAHAIEGGRKAGSETGQMDAQPFMNPAKRLMRKRINGRMQRAISKAAKRVAGTGR